MSARFSSALLSVALLLLTISLVPIFSDQLAKQTGLDQLPQNTELNDTNSRRDAASEPFDILIYGNSYTSANNLASLTEGGLTGAGFGANVDSLTAGGMTLDGHAQNAQTSGHTWNTTLNSGTQWDYVVLQDQSQVPGFYRTSAYWLDSLNGAEVLDGFAEDVGAETILLMTWGRRDGDSGNQHIFPDYPTMQNRLEDGYIDYRDNMSSPTRDVWIAPAGLAFEHIYELVVAAGGTPSNSGNLFYDLYTSDGSHPSLSGSYLTACVLYATITGDDPVGLSHSTALSNARVLELQQAAAATVFNETPHLSYPWQILTTGNSTSAMSNVIGSFNGTIPYPLNTVYLDIDTFPDMSFGAHLEPVVQDFFQLKNGSYMVLITTEASGTFTNGEPYYDGGNALIMLNQDGDMVDAKGYSNYVGDSLSSMQLIGAFTAGEYFHVHGAHTMINLDEEYIILAGTIGHTNKRYQSIGGVINSSTAGEHIFVAKVNLSTFEIDSYTIFYTVGGNNNQWCKVAVFEGSFVNSTAFMIVVSSYVESTNPRCISISIGGTSHSATSILTTNILVTMDHNLSVMNSIEVPSGLAHSTPILLENGYAVLREQSSVDKLRILSPGSNSWSTVNTNCEDIWDVVALNNESIFFLCGYLAGSISGSPTIYPVYFHAYNTTSGTMSDQHIGYADDFGGFIFQKGYIAIDSDRILVTFTQMSFTTLTNIRFYETTTIEVNLTSNVSTIFQLGYFQFKGYQDSSVRSHPGNFALYRSMVRGESSLMILKGDSGTGTKYVNLKILEIDTDIDGYADRVDAFPFEQSQWSDADGDGYGDNPTGILADDCPNQVGNSTLDFIGCVDTDGDGQSNQGDQFPIDATQISDIDSDGYGDNMSGVRGDACPNQYGESNRNGTFGCQDIDFDGWADSQDEFPAESSQWKDSDGDGFGNQYNGFEGDTCPTIFGTSSQDTFGCPDADGDGWSDDGDDFPFENTQWEDRDGDGYGDNENGNNPDAFQSDGTQWNDSDDDLHGDNPYGTEGDWFPENPDRWQDTDRDGVADEDDDFINDATQWNDTDGDGYGDEVNGNRADAFPNDPAEWMDSDDDGLGNNADDFPFDPTQSKDRDGDGMGDNPMGIGADKFPDDVTQWGDIDGDGYGDNPNGNNSDAFFTDPTQWSDRDGDEYGDNPAGRLYDQFPDNPTQWQDADGDGLGDNLSGTDADPYLNDFDNDGYNDSIDPLPKLASPGDLDNDGCLDEVDAFPNNARECKDFDGDGIGDVEDPDDDNDGWADTDEARMGTDPFSAADVPVEGFEVVFPIPGGGAIGLGAWDLIGMFGGVPLFTWLAFCFVTRGGRAGRFEAEMNVAQSREVLASIARGYEFSLMLRLIGPHQGIRLERLRAELDDSLESRLAAALASGDGTATGEDGSTGVSGASGGKTRDGSLGPSIVAKAGVSLLPQQPAPDEVGVVGSDGYEWIRRHDGAAWYRVPNSGSAWSWWNN